MSEKTDHKTLLDSEIVTTSHIGRRSSLRRIGAGMLGAAVLVAVGAHPATAEAQSGPSDQDSGPGEDPAGRGRTGVSDRDAGPNEDRPGHGVCAMRGVSDSDSGPGEDPGGRGRGPCHP